MTFRSITDLIEYIVAGDSESLCGVVVSVAGHETLDPLANVDSHPSCVCRKTFYIYIIIIVIIIIIIILLFSFTCTNCIRKD